MQFINRIRLPFKITRPQFPKDKSTFRYSDGSSETLSVQVRKTYEGETEWLPEKVHQRLVIAMEHDNVTIEGDKYLGGIITDGDYEIDWQKFLDYPTGKAAFVVQVTPFDNTNSNCMTCEEAIQLSLVDDTFPDPLEEDGAYELNIAANDSICCYPAIFSILSFDTTYIQSASISELGILSIVMKSIFFTMSDLKLLTYRVTCPNGSFDDTDVFGDTSGEPAPCNAPSNFSVVNRSTSATVSFDPAIPAPDHYFWRLFRITPFTFLQQGTVINSPIELIGLTPGVQCALYTRSQCDATNNDSPASNFIQINIDPPFNTDQCGEYTAFYSSVFGPSQTTVTYLDCNGAYKNIIVPKNQSRTFCAMQTSPGVSVSITRGSSVIFHGTDSNCTPPAESILLFRGAGNGVPGDACSNIIGVWIATSDVDINPGINVYEDPDLTILLTSYSFIADAGGTIFYLSGGTVGSPTGLSC